MKNFSNLYNLYKQAEIIVPKYHIVTDEVLENLHLEKKLSPEEISLIVQKSAGQIYRRLNKLDILTNFKREIILSSIHHEIIEGILIGDGHIIKNPLSCALYVGQKFDKIEFLQYLSNELPFKHRIYNYVPKPHYKTGKIYPEVRYNSTSYYCLNNYYNRWYNENEKKENEKIIPFDFKITPISMLFWFIGDGRYGQNKYIELATNCFTHKDIEHKLIPQFKCLNIDCRIQNNCAIYIGKKYVQTFFNYTKKCPVKCYEYKWPLIPLTYRKEVNKDKILN